MADIFPLDLGENCEVRPGPGSHQPVRRFSSQPHGAEKIGISSKRRCSFSYSKSLSWGSVDTAASWGSSPRTSLSYSAAILFKDARGVPVIQPLKSPASRSSSIDDDILNFFKCYKCYDLIPSSGKLVVLDTTLSLKQAFLAMLDSGVRSCPLWRSDSQIYAGLVTADDFIKIIQNNYVGSLLEMKVLDEKKLENWLEEANNSKTFEHVFPDASLYQAISSMIAHKTHRLPIIDPESGNVLYILNQRQLLRFLLNFVPNLQYFDHLTTSIVSAGVGTYTNVKVASYGTKVVDAVNQFVTHNISSLPIVDKQGKCVDVFCKFDMIQMAASHTFSDLEVTVAQALEERKQYFEGVFTCRGEDSVLSVIERLVCQDVSQLVVTEGEEAGGVEGVVTISDILHYLVTVHRQSTAPPHQHQRRGSSATAAARLRQRREDSIGEELEDEDTEESPDTEPDLYKPSCSPPRWFDV